MNRRTLLKLTGAGALGALIAGPKALLPEEAEAAVHAIEIERGTGWDVTIRLYKDAIESRTVNIEHVRNLLKGNERTIADAERVATLLIQEAWDADERIPIADLPADDPAKTTDPNTATQFWVRPDPAQQIGQGQSAVTIYSRINTFGSIPGIGGTPTHLQGRNTLINVRYVGAGDFNTLDPLDWNVVTCVPNVNGVCPVGLPPPNLP